MKRTFTPRKSKRILIVSDDPASASLYRERLESERYCVEIASDGRRALRIIEIDPVDLVLIDISKTAIHGLVTIRSIRALPSTRAVHVIALSNHFFGRQLEAVEEGGADRCVTKTDCTPGQLVRIVRAAFERATVPGPQLAAIPTETNVPSGDVVEVDFQERVRRAFYHEAPGAIARLRAAHRTYARSQTEDQRLAELSEMHRQAGLLANAAGLAGFRRISQLASALGAFLVLKQEESLIMTPSNFRMIAGTVDVLAALFQKAFANEPEATELPAILVVEGRTAPANTISEALGRVGLSVTKLAETESPMDRCATDPFDLILIDLETPDLDGLSLCASIRKAPVNRFAPVIFATDHADLPSRARASLSGGSDLIAKPFSAAELVVEVLTWLSRGNITAGLFQKGVPLPASTPQQSPWASPAINKDNSSLGNFSPPLKHAC
jgi:CheY-like chemotaxis protein